MSTRRQLKIMGKQRYFCPLAVCTKTSQCECWECHSEHPHPDTKGTFLLPFSITVPKPHEQNQKRQNWCPNRKVFSNMNSQGLYSHFVVCHRLRSPAPTLLSLCGSDYSQVTPSSLLFIPTRCSTSFFPFPIVQMSSGRPPS